MTTSTRSRYVASVSGKELRTRKQFLETLEQLGGKPGVSYCRSAEDTSDPCIANDPGRSPDPRRNPLEPRISYARINSEIDEVHAGFLSCSLDTWKCHFGEPESISEHREFAIRRPLQCWEHQCADGPVECVGRLFERWPDGPWVIVMRVSIPVDIGRTARLSR